MKEKKNFGKKKSKTGRKDSKKISVDAEKLKEIIREEEKDSELEEQIEESEIITQEEARHFIVPEKTAPVLKRVQTSENLEENVASTPVMRSETANEAVMDYSAGGNYSSANYSAGSKKYEHQETANPLVLRESNIEAELQHKELLSLSDEMQRNSFSSERKNISVKQFEEHHKMPFEKREKKYKTL